MPSSTTVLARALANEQDVLTEWVRHQYGAGTVRSDLMSERELREQSHELTRLLSKRPIPPRRFSLNSQWQVPSGFLPLSSSVVTRAHWTTISGACLKVTDYAPRLIGSDSVGCANVLG